MSDKQHKNMDMERLFPRDRTVVGSLCYVLRENDAGEREVLLLRRNRPPQQHLWSAPGGKMELGESPDECVIREVNEETGLTIINPDLRAIVTVFDQEHPIHWLLFIYRAETFTGETRFDTEEGEVRWIKFSELDNFPRPYADQQHWAHILSEDVTVWRGKFLYDTPHSLLDEIHYTE